MPRRYYLAVVKNAPTAPDDGDANKTSVEKIEALFNEGVLTRSGAIECLDLFAKKPENARLYREFQELREKLEQTLPLKAEAGSTEARMPGLMG